MSEHTKHLDHLTLSMMVDDMLSQQESAKCHQHLSECKQCEQAYDDLVAMSFAMTKLPVIKPPADLVENIMAHLPPQDQVDSGKIIEIKEHHVKKDFFASLDMRQVACFAACVLLGGSFLLSSPSMDTVETRGGTGGETSSQQEGDVVASDMLREMPVPEDFENNSGTNEEVMAVTGVEETMIELGEEGKRSFLTPNGGLSKMTLKMFEDVVHDSFWLTDPKPQVALFTNGYPEGTAMATTFSEDKWAILEEVPDMAYLKVTYTEDLPEELKAYLLGEYKELSGLLEKYGDLELLFVYVVG